MTGCDRPPFLKRHPNRFPGRVRGARFEYTVIDDLVSLTPPDSARIKRLLKVFEETLIGKAVKIIEQALGDDDLGFATQTALALLRVAKGGGLSGLGATGKGSGGDGDGAEDDADGEMELSDGDVWAGARGRYEGEHK